MPTLLGPPPPLPDAALIAPTTSSMPPGVHPGVPSAAAAHGSTHRTSRRARDLQRRLGGLVATNASASPTGAGAGSERAAADPAAQAASDSSPAPRPVDSEAEYPASSRAGTPGDALHTLLAAQVTPVVEAQVLPTQRFLIPKGAFIDCTLETAIDSTLPGMTTCITATDTFGADGQVVLLERGTKLVGETRGEVEQGKARLFVLWTEARTPTGVVMPLASPATDELGRSGLAGAVNRHFWQRFGAAMLVSVIDGTVQGVALSQEKSGSALIVSPSSSSDIVEEVLRGTINIPPTVTVAQGSRIEVLVARDLDFRPVYELKMLKTRTTAATPELSR